MPLIKRASKKALQENIKTEMDANPGKDNRAKNLAIAYSVQRQARKKKMASGGMISTHEDEREHLDNQRESDKMLERERPKMSDGGILFEDEKEHDLEEKQAKKRLEDERPRMADGGMLFEDEEEHDRTEREMDREHEEELPAMSVGGEVEKHMAEHMGDHTDEYMNSMVDEIMRRLDQRRMADGGMVDIDSNAREEPNHEDDLSFEALKKENYSEDDALMDQPEDSNLHGRDLPDADEHDHIEEMRRKIKNKRGM